jgi:hypothetical protein
MLESLSVKYKIMHMICLSIINLFQEICLLHKIINSRTPLGTYKEINQDYSLKCENQLKHFILLNAVTIFIFMC